MQFSRWLYSFQLTIAWAVLLLMITVPTLHRHEIPAGSPRTSLDDNHQTPGARRKDKLLKNLQAHMLPETVLLSTYQR